MATILGVVLFSEPLSFMQILGGALIIIGGVIQIMSSARKVESADRDMAEAMVG